ncbi:MAG: protein-disulfide reductase DsbD domain-containing protein [Bacteroidota bacterium]
MNYRLHHWISFFIIMILGPLSWAQIEDPVDWSFSKKDLGNGEYELVFIALVDEGWHIYSQFTAPNGPIPTSFTYESKDNVELIGKAKEIGEVEKGYDEIFMTEVSSFKGDATFKQKVKVNAESATVSGYLTYMVCNDEKCLPPRDEEFSFSLSGPSPKIEKVAPAETQKVEKAKPEEKKQPKVTQAEKPSQSETPAFDPPTVEIPTNGLSDQSGDIEDPVSATYEQKRVSDNELDLIFKLTIEEGWKIYAPEIPLRGTVISFEEGDAPELVGTLTPDHEPKSYFDPVFKEDSKSFEKAVTFTQRVKVNSDGGFSGFLTYYACNDEKCLAPEDIVFEGSLSGTVDQTNITGQEALTILSSTLKRNTIDRENPASECIQESDYSNIWGLFFKGIFWGIFALLTPCIFPMIPLTVSFFTKSSQNRKEGIINGLIYGLSILSIYALVSLPFHLVPGLDASIFNVISTDPILNIVFFSIFVVFAFSFFGFFEITIPSAVANSANRKGTSTKGFLGIFFMALTLTIVSFSCTGPLFGNVFALSAGDFVSAWSVTAAAAGFGVALGLPFALFAAFPSLLNSLPSSGSWLGTTKVVLGFLEIGLAMKFLSNADLVSHWGILKREIFIGIWMVIALLTAAYLLGFIKFPHEPKVAFKNIAKGRIALAVVCLLFIGYLAPGFWTTRPLVSGFLPPMYYSIFEKDTECPHDLNCFRDYEEGLAYAKSVNKPVMIDFTGYACVNCRDMEENVWPKQEIMRYISEDYVLISLYVDDRKKLDEPMIIKDKNGKERKLRTIGNKWAQFQEVNFRNNSQPYYALMSPNEVLLNTPVGYTPDVNEYQTFLECGLNTFKQMANK